MVFVQFHLTGMWIPYSFFLSKTGTVRLYPGKITFYLIFERGSVKQRIL
jgi:hypothetical protein